MVEGCVVRGLHDFGVKFSKINVEKICVFKKFSIPLHSLYGNSDFQNIKSSG